MNGYTLPFRHSSFMLPSSFDIRALFIFISLEQPIDANGD